MAGQHPSRRQVLEALAAASVAATAAGFSRWSWAFSQAPTSKATSAHHTHTAATPHSESHSNYRPVFFSAPEYTLVETVAELILPRTGQHAATPAAAVASASHHSTGAKARPSHLPVVPADAGATDAGVAEFIDFMVSQDTTLQQLFRDGLQWLNTAAGANGFVTLAPAQRTALLERVAYKKNLQPGDEPGRDFFLLARKYTVMGFYTSRIGLESLDYPGLRFYAESPSVPQDAFLKMLGV